MNITVILDRILPWRIGCHQASEVIQAYLDRDRGADLGDVPVDQLERHLEACRRCGLEAEQYRQIKASLSELRNDDESSMSRLLDVARDLDRDQPE